MGRNEPDAEGRLVEVHVEVLQVDRARGQAALAWKGHFVGRQHGFDIEGTLEGSMRLRSDGLLAHVDFVASAKGKGAGNVQLMTESFEEHEYAHDEPTATR